MRIVARLTILILVGSVFVGPASAVQSINLLPLGDSITEQGYYIAPLVAQLTNNGYNPTVIANEGHGGFAIAQLDSGIATYLNHPNVNAANTYILLMIGINDMVGNDYPPGAPDRLRTLISDIRWEAPLAQLIVAQLTPPNWDANVDALVRQFNQDIVPVVEYFSPNASLVDMYTPFMPDPLPYMQGVHNVHPNQAGGDLMATVWYNGITAVPEPGTMVLLGIAAASLLAYVRQKRK